MHITLYILGFFNINYVVPCCILSSNVYIICTQCRLLFVYIYVDELLFNDVIVNLCEYYFLKGK